jgi:hypothetical protein
MWFIFIVPVTILGAAGALFGLVNGAPIIVVTIAADQWQRRRGYKPGEGLFTDREGGHVFGLRVEQDSPEDLGKGLSGLVLAFPDMFQEFDKKRFDLTESEGKMLRAMIEATKGHFDDYAEASQYVSSGGNEEPEYRLEMQHIEERLRASLVPVAMFLRNVPEVRVKKAA